MPLGIPCSPGPGSGLVSLNPKLEPPFLLALAMPLAASTASCRAAACGLINAPILLASLMLLKLRVASAIFPMAFSPSLNTLPSDDRSGM